MREFDEYGLKMCRFQGQLFLMSREKTACSTPVFLRRFMYSEVAVRMDGEGFLFESETQEDVFDEKKREQLPEECQFAFLAIEALDICTDTGATPAGSAVKRCIR